MADHLTELDPLFPGCRYVSFLPLAWIGEQMLAVGCGLRRRLTLSFPEDAATQRTDLREIGPDVLFSPPRICESLVSEVRVRIDEAGWVKRRVFGWAFKVGDRTSSAPDSSIPVTSGLARPSNARTKPRPGCSETALVSLAAGHGHLRDRKEEVIRDCIIGADR